jgi:hypothetical protein
MIKFTLIVAALLAMLCNASCVQGTRPIKVNFEVDTRSIENISTIGVIGAYDPLNWNKKMEMTDEDNDGIYLVSAVFHIPYDEIEYKYVLNEKVIELDGKGNRRVNVKDQNEITIRSIFDVESN